MTPQQELRALLLISALIDATDESDFARIKESARAFQCDLEARQRWQAWPVTEEPAL